MSSKVEQQKRGIWISPLIMQAAFLVQFQISRTQSIDEYGTPRCLLPAACCLLSVIQSCLGIMQAVGVSGAAGQHFRCCWLQARPGGRQEWRPPGRRSMLSFSFLCQLPPQRGRDPLALSPLQRPPRPGLAPGFLKALKTSNEQAYWIFVSFT